MRHHRLGHSALIVLLALAGCAPAATLRPAAEQPAPPERAQAREPGARAQSARHTAVPCPTAIPGTVVMATALEDGAGLIFVAPARNVEELRRRVRALARTQNRGARQVPDAEVGAGAATLEADDSREPTATVRDIEGGARLDFTPSGLDKVTDVQANVYDYAQRLAGGTCPLMRDEASLLPAHARARPMPAVIPPVPPGLIPGIGGLHGFGTLPATGVTF